jgi:ABC-type multidrug transport system permease subunit
MRNILKIISKNLKLLIRSRSSALIIILAPLLVILLLGVAFDNANVFGITVGVYSDNYSEDVEKLLGELAEQELQIVKYETEEKCVNDIKQGVSNTCIVFPADLSLNSNEQKQILFHVDQSKLNLVWMVMDTLNDRFGSGAKQISRNLIGVLINKIETSKTELEAKQDSISSLRTQATAAKSGVGDIATELNALDFSYDENETFPTTALQTEMDGVGQNLSTFLDTIESKVTSARNQENGTSTGNKLDDALVAVLAAIEVVEGSTPPSFIHMKATLETLKTNIEGLQSQLIQASQIRESAGPRLDDVNNQLNSGLTNIEDISASFDAIIADIQSIQVTNPEAIAEPFVTEIRPVSAPTTYLNYLFPSLIILVIMFISMLLSTTLVMMEKHSPAYFRNFITPTRNITFTIGTYLTNMLLVIIQLGIILAIAGYFFSAQITPVFAEVIGILLLAATFFTLWGMGIGYVFTSEETATLATITSGSVFLFISSVIIPLESMPPLVRQIAAYNPFVICERVLREVLLFQPEFNLIQNDLYLLGAYSIVLFGLIIAFQGLLNKHFIQKITYKRHKRQRQKGGKPKKEKKEKHKKTSFSTKQEIKKVPAQRISFGLGLGKAKRSKRRERQPEKTTITTKRIDKRHHHLNKKLDRINDELERMYKR